MSSVSDEKILAIGRVLADQERPLKERFRALFTLKNLGGPTAIKCIEACFDDPSALLKHELAYCLGQMSDRRAMPILKSVLADKTQEPMVRHEAAEALGAIASPEAIDILKEYLQDPVKEVSETCELALERIKWINSNDAEKVIKSPFNSIDPAPPSEEKDVKSLEKTLINEGKSLFERYRAMFALRNINTDDSAAALSEGLLVGSALFKHEIAFVLGQMQRESCVPYLKQSLENSVENEMVRHECAEALGAIASDDCYKILQQYVKDEKRVVKESCEIALDMCEYENSPEFQYADTLFKV